MQRYGPVTWPSFELERSAEARQLEPIAWLAMSDGCSWFWHVKGGEKVSRNEQEGAPLDGPLLLEYLLGGYFNYVQTQEGSRRVSVSLFKNKKSVLCHF
jgi:hypothetical protein